jgi:hypothetical protein
MATSPIYGWLEPDNTDLVKNGALAIRTLGNAIDTTMGTMTPKSIVDAKGDLIAASANDTPARLAVGNNGETLVADSSTSTGLRWQGSYAAAKNVLINGNADFWQRGTTSAAIANGTYLADRWKTLLSGTSLNATYSRDTSVPNGASKYSMKLQQLSSSATSVSEFAFRQAMEGATVYQLIGNQVTVSFWYRSNQTGSHYVRIGASLLTGGTDTTQSFTVSAADTWEKKSLTFASFASVTAANLADNAEAAIIDIGIRTFGSGGTETVAANDYFQVTQIMLEAGSVATQFSRAGGTIQGELAACQRYYYRINANGGASNYAIGFGIATSTTNCRATVSLPVSLRSGPSVSIAGTSGVALVMDGSLFTSTTVAAVFPNQPASIYFLDFTSSGMTANTSGNVYTFSNGNDILQFSAEL